MVKNIFKREKSKPVSMVAPVRPTPLVQPPESLQPPTLLQLERENLARLQAELHDLQLQEHNKEQAIGHVRENISRLELHPWFQDLYIELRSREAMEVTGKIPQEFIDTIKLAQDSGLIEKPSGTV